LVLSKFVQAIIMKLSDLSGAMHRFLHKDSSKVYFVFVFSFLPLLGFKPEFNLLEIESTNGIAQHLGPHGATHTGLAMRHTESGSWPSWWPSCGVGPAGPFSLRSLVGDSTERDGMRLERGDVLTGAKLPAIAVSTVWLKGTRG
jgi:hypothetical protein